MKTLIAIFFLWCLTQNLYGHAYPKYLYYTVQTQTREQLQVERVLGVKAKLLFNNVYSKGILIWKKYYKTYTISVESSEQFDYMSRMGFKEITAVHLELDMSRHSDTNSRGAGIYSVRHRDSYGEKFADSKEGINKLFNQAKLIIKDPLHFIPKANEDFEADFNWVFENSHLDHMERGFEVHIDLHLSYFDNDEGKRISLKRRHLRTHYLTPNGPEEYFIFPASNHIMSQCEKNFVE